MEFDFSGNIFPEKIFDKSSLLIFEKSRSNLFAKSLFNINISGDFTGTGLISSLNIFGYRE